MVLATSSVSSSVRIVPGFTKRLNAVLSMAGFRTYGRLQVVREYTGLSLAGVKKMYNADRPPRPKTLDRLAENLLKALSDVQSVNYTVKELKDYLLLDQGDFEVNRRTPDKDEFDIADFVRRDPVYTSQIIIKIEEVARENDIDTAGQISPKDMRLIQFRIISYCHKNRSDKDSPKVRNMISALLELSTQGLL